MAYDNLRGALHHYFIAVTLCGYGFSGVKVPGVFSLDIDHGSAIGTGFWGAPMALDTDSSAAGASQQV
jgi:hypothetical protein